MIPARTAFTLAVCASFAGCAPKIERGPVATEIAMRPVRLVELPVADAPNVYFAAIVAAGSAYDPVGQEGTASLVAGALVDAGAGDRSAEDVRNALFGTGNGFDVVVGREWTSIRLRCQKDDALLCAELFTDALAHPRFDPDDVARLRDRALQQVTDGLLSDEEALGLEVFDAALYEGHPYGHPPEGRSGVLPTIDADDLRTFYDAHYLRQMMVAGIAGAYDDATKDVFTGRLTHVRPGRRPAFPLDPTGSSLALMAPAPVSGRSLVAVDTDTPVTGIHFGHPLDLDRNDPDWPAMLVATTALGAHRQTFGRLFRALRGDRGLNYGDYAYIEPYQERGRSPAPDQGVLRRQNRFVVWIRPTSIENGPFALKLAIDEVQDWVDHGLAPQEFADVRDYLRNGLPLLATDPGRRLLYALDAEATGTPNLLDTLPAALDALTEADVAAAIPRHIHPKDLRIVAVSGEAQRFADALVEQTPTPIVYDQGEADPSRVERDGAVAAEILGIDRDAVSVVDASGVFR